MTGAPLLALGAVSVLAGAALVPRRGSRARPDAEAVIAAFAAPCRPFDRCKRTSIGFLAALRRAGIGEDRAWVVQVEGWKGDAKHADRRWHALGGPTWWKHYVVRLDEEIIDWTARQFDPSLPVPWRYPKTDLRRYWSETWRVPELPAGSRAIRTFYHGTSSERAAAAILEAGPNLDHPRVHGEGELGWGFYVTSDPRLAKAYAAGPVLEVAVEDANVARLRNLFRYTVPRKTEAEQLFVRSAGIPGKRGRFYTLHAPPELREVVARVVRNVFLARGWQAIAMDIGADAPGQDEVAIFDPSIIRRIRRITPELDTRLFRQVRQAPVSWFSTPWAPE